MSLAALLAKKNNAAVAAAGGAATVAPGALAAPGGALARLLASKRRADQEAESTPVPTTRKVDFSPAWLGAGGSEERPLPAPPSREPGQRPIPAPTPIFCPACTSSATSPVSSPSISSGRMRTPTSLATGPTRRRSPMAPTRPRRLRGRRHDVGGSLPQAASRGSRAVLRPGRGVRRVPVRRVRLWARPTRTVVSCAVATLTCPSLWCCERVSMAIGGIGPHRISHHHRVPALAWHESLMITTITIHRVQFTVRRLGDRPIARSAARLSPGRIGGESVDFPTTALTARQS